MTDTNATAQAPDDEVMGMGEAPERIWCNPEGHWFSFDDSEIRNSPSVEYIRADLHQATLDAAEADKARVVEASPLTAADLAEALSCFWNAAIGESHRQQDGITFAAIMAEGMAAVEHRLRDIAGAAALRTEAKP